MSILLSTKEWMDKVWSIHTTEYYTTFKKNEPDLYASTEIFTVWVEKNVAN